MLLWAGLRRAMTYSILIVAYRKPDLTPEEFRDYYNDRHVPLIREITGEHFPLSHTRQYIHRNESAGFPADVVVGSQSDFEYDALAQLSFADEDAFDTFWALCLQPGNAERIAADEEQFLDRPRLRVVVLGERASTSR